MLTWKSIFGQDEALTALRSAYRADRLPHGLIFAGPIGVGKATTAAVLSQLFLCEQPKDDIACGICESCRIFAAGNHPDYHVITKELIRYHDKTGKSKGIDLSINVIRPELIEAASRKSAMGRGKIFIVEQADLMNPAAQNALLKTLEEPAGRTLIILLTNQPSSLLATVRSRARVVRFAALDSAIVLRELKKRNIAKDVAEQAAKLASGSLGLALKWIEDGVVGPAGELIAQLDALLQGTAPADLPGWLRKAADDYAATQLKRDELSSKEQATREGLNASRDETAKAARDAGDARVEVLTHAVNRGVGRAIVTGYLRAMETPGSPRDAFVVMAGDGQMDPRDLRAVAQPIALGRADYVKGCRFDWPGVKEEMPKARYLGGAAFSALTSRAVGQPIKDSQCGFTALSRSAASLLDLPGLWPRYGYPNDILGQLAARRMVIAEVPVRPVYADETSHLKLRHLPAIFGLIARAYVRTRAARR